MIHARPRPAPHLRLLSTAAPALVLAQFPADAAWLLPWAAAGAAALVAAWAAVPLVQRRRWRSREAVPDIPVFFAPPGAGTHPVPHRPHPAPAPPPPGATAAGDDTAAGSARPDPVARPTPRAPAARGDGFPPDGTLQVLPGRLEVLSGAVEGGEWGREVRFVRIPGSPAEVTLGRGDGPGHRHVRLASATVSRRHARLRYADGEWTLRNLSRTNPTLVNGEALGEDEATLREGDRVEMGEVVFRFRAR